jgi:hypothetical protein
MTEAEVLAEIEVIKQNLIAVANGIEKICDRKDFHVTRKERLEKKRRLQILKENISSV